MAADYQLFLSVPRGISTSVIAQFGLPERPHSRNRHRSSRRAARDIWRVLPKQLTAPKMMLLKPVGVYAVVFVCCFFPLKGAGRLFSNRGHSGSITGCEPKSLTFSSIRFQRGEKPCFHTTRRPRATESTTRTVFGEKRTGVSFFEPFQSKSDHLGRL